MRTRLSENSRKALILSRKLALVQAELLRLVAIEADDNQHSPWAEKPTAVLAAIEDIRLYALQLTPDESCLPKKK